MRGEKEQKCLEIVKLDCRNNYPHRFFGLNYEEVEELNQILNETKANEELSEFPDFIFDNGFIEHFQITSSKEEIGKGSEHIKEINKFEGKIRKEKLKIQADKNFTSKHWTMKYPEHSHKYLVNSFMKNWNSHLEGFQKYKGKKDVSIFMIQYSDMALEMYENVYEYWIDGMSNGDLRKPEKLNCYRMSRDKKILKYMYEFKDKIKYVIFVYGEKCEGIKLENIPYILGLIPWNYVIASKMNTMLISSTYKIPNVVIGDEINE